MQLSSTVFLIDDKDAFTDSLVQSVSSTGLTVVRFATGGDFLQYLETHHSGCVVIDLCKPHLDGMHVLDELGRRPLPTPAVVLTANADVQSVVRASHHGVVAFLQKQHASRTEILDAIQAALKSDAQQRMIHARREEVRACFATLTNDERLVLDLILQGDELLAIAKALNVSRRTVEARRAKLMKKLGVTTFAGLIALATEHRGFPSAS